VVGYFKKRGRSPPLLTIDYSIEVVQTILKKYNNKKILIKTCTEKK
jgi:hypothetical protein